MKSLFKLIGAKTPAVGKSLAKFGAFLLVVFTSVTVMENQVIISFPEEYTDYVNAGKMVLAGIGVFLTGAGISSTVEDPDKIVKK